MKRIAGWSGWLVAGAIVLIMFCSVAWGAEKPAVEEAPAKFEPVIPKVTLSVKGAPLEAVAADLSRQTGMTIHLNGLLWGEKRLTLAVKDMPLPEALVKITALTGTGLGHSSVTPALDVWLTRPQGGPVAAAGPCILSEMTPDVWYQSDTLLLSPEVIVVGEPVPFGVRISGITEVLDAEGRRVQWSAQGRAEFGEGRPPQPVQGRTRTSGTCVVSLQATGFDSGALFPRTIRGQVELAYALETEEVVFDLMRDVGREREVGGVTITYLGLKRYEQKGDEVFNAIAVDGEAWRVTPFVWKDALGRAVVDGHGIGPTHGSRKEWGFRPYHADIATVSCQVATKVAAYSYPFELKGTRPEGEGNPGGAE